MGISFKLNSMIVGLTLCAGVLLGGFFIHYQELQQTEALDRRAAAIIDSLAYNSRYPVLVADSDGLATLFRGLMGATEIVYGAAQDAEGNLLYEVGQPGQENTRSFRQPVISASLLGADLGATGAFLENPEKEQIGLILLDFSLSELQAEQDRMRLVVVAAVTMLVIGLAFTAALCIRKLVVNPLRVLTTGMATIGAGQLNQRITLNTRDEMSRLAASFNQMTADLSNTMVSKDFLDDVVQSMNDGLVVLDDAGRIKIVNRAVVQMSGYAEKELLGKKIAEILSADFFSSTETTSTSSRLSNLELELQQKGGSLVPILFSRAPLKAESGQQNAAVCVVVDMSEQRRAEQALRDSARQIQEQNEEMQKFLFISSHDLQEPLRKIQTFCSRLGGEAEHLSHKGRHMFSRLTVAVGRMSTLLEALRAFSEVNVEKKERRQVDLTTLAHKVCGSLQTAIDEASAQLSIGQLPRVQGDAAQLQHLLTSLLDNALKFRNPERLLQISVEGNLTETGGCEIRIADTGIGFEQKYAERIFEVFQQLHGADKYPGTGMGLAICRKIARRHGGDLRATGRPDHGAEFVLHLPEATETLDVA